MDTHKKLAKSKELSRNDISTAQKYYSILQKYYSILKSFLLTLYINHLRYFLATKNNFRVLE